MRRAPDLNSDGRKWVMWKDREEAGAVRWLECGAKSTRMG